MKVELRVGAAVVSCETDYRPDPSGKCSENDAARKALFERLLEVVSEKMREWMDEPRLETDGGSQIPDGLITMPDKWKLKPCPATEEDIESGKAKWCSVCVSECPDKGKDLLCICERFREDK